VIEALFAAPQRVREQHVFGIGWAAAIVVPPGPDAEAVVLLNPRITGAFDGKIATLYVNGRQRGSARLAYTGMSLGGRRPL
jgi:hypothetical protein